MKESSMLMEKLKQLETKRKNGEISSKEFYKGLLKLLKDLEEVLIKEDISDADVKMQIPLLLTFIKSQIKKLEARGG